MKSGREPTDAEPFDCAQDMPFDCAQDMHVEAAGGVLQQLARNELAAEVVRSSGELRLRVTGSSMLPAIRPGDVLVIRRCTVEDARMGDVVLFTRYGGMFAHRVVSRSSSCLVTQGDAIEMPDPPVSASELLGRVCRIVRRGKSVPAEPTSTFSRRLAAALFRRSAIAGRLFIRLDNRQTRAGR